MIIYCSKALQTALKRNKKDFATSEQLSNEDNLFYACEALPLPYTFKVGNISIAKNIELSAY